MQILAPLAHPPIARLWMGQTLSALGDQAHNMALIWLAVQLAGADAGFVSAAECAAVLAAALFAGPIVDRWDPRKTMIAADLVRAGLALVPVVAAAMDRLTLATLVIPSLALAGLRSVFDPAMQASLPRLAHTRRLLIGTNALMDATARIARLLGPALVGLLAGILPTVGLMGVNAITFTVSALAIVSLRRALPTQPFEKTHATSVRDSLLRGARAIAARPIFIYLLWRGGAVAGLWFVALWLCLPFAVQHGGIHGFGLEGLAATALVMGAYGVGNLISNLVVGSLTVRRPLPMILAGNAIVGVGLVFLGVAVIAAPSGMTLLALAAAAAFTALGGPLTDIPMALLRQTMFPVAEIPAVYRLTIVFEWGGMLLANLCAPMLLRHAEPSALMVATGASIVAVALFGALRYGGLANAFAARDDGESIRAHFQNASLRLSE